MTNVIFFYGKNESFVCPLEKKILLLRGILDKLYPRFEISIKTSLL